MRFPSKIQKNILLGIQTQTAECLVIGELACDHLIIALNKIDLLEIDNRQKSIEKMTKKLKTTLASTKFCDSTIHPLSASTNENVSEFIEILKQKAFIPKRNTKTQPFLFAVDHCFSIKGQGTVCTGTVLQGTCKIGDSIEFPTLKLSKKIKSIQMFRTAMQTAYQGDRIGICVTQFDPKLLERGLIAQPDYISHTQIAIISLNIIKYYKLAIKSKSKFHINIGHETIMAKCTLFTSEKPDFDIKDEYEYLDEYSQWISLPENKYIFCLLEFEQSISIVPGSLLIGAKLDMDVNTTQCRIAFWGKILPKQSDISLDNIRIYKEKTKEGHVQRVIDDHAVIVDHMFKRESNRGMFIGQPIRLSTGECGTLECWFGYTTKVKVNIPKGLSDTTKDKIKQNQMKSIVATMKYKKFLHDKSIR